MIIAPKVSPEAAAVVEAKKNVRLLACGEWPSERIGGLNYKRVNGGLLVADRDNGILPLDDWMITRYSPPTYSS